MTLRHHFFIPVATLILLCACNNESEPDMPTTHPDSEVYSKGRSTYWSSYSHKDVTLFEIHSDVADFELECDQQPGYNIRLEKQSSTDAHGFHVYRVAVDMDAIDITDTNKSNTIAFNVTLCGTGYKDGRKVIQVCKYTPQIQRYFLAECESDILKRNWYLSQSKIESNHNWVVWKETNQNYSFPPASTIKYCMSESEDTENNMVPTPYFTTSADDSFLYFTHRNEACFGWDDSEYFSCRTTLKHGCLHFPESDKELQIIYINDKKIICTAELTDSYNNLITRYTYTLTSY